MKSRNLGGCPVGMTRVREAGDRCPRFPSPGVHYLTERPWLAEAIMLLSLESPAPTLLCCAQAGFQIIHFGTQTFGKVAAEAGEVVFDQRDFGEPAVDIDAEEFVHVGGFQVEAFCVKIFYFRYATDRRVFGVDFAVGAFEYPFQDTAVLALGGPEAFPILVLAKPVDVEN